MPTYYLYKKTHNNTNLKYLGFTKHDPFKYKGSGKYWASHLKVHGNNVNTEVLLETDSKDLIQEAGTYYSNLWNVVESAEWANLKPESGDGGGVTGMNKGKERPQSHRNAMKAGWERKKKEGYVPHNKGKKYGPSAKSIPCVLISPDGKELEYPSMRRACIEHNLPTSMMSEVKNGKLPHCKGWRVKDQ